MLEQPLQLIFFTESIKNKTNIEGVWFIEDTINLKSNNNLLNKIKKMNIPYWGPKRLRYIYSDPKGTHMRRTRKKVEIICNMITPLDWKKEN